MAQIERRDEIRNHNGNAGAFLVGSILGGLTAAAAMLLYAPRSGADTQELIRQKADEFRAEAEKTLQNRRQEAEESIAMRLSSVAGRLEEVATTLNQQAEDMKEKT
jgi:gas vesicle protein